MVVLGNAGGEFGFFVGVVDNFMRIADPAAFGLVGLIGVEMFVSISHYSFYYITEW